MADKKPGGFSPGFSCRCARHGQQLGGENPLRARQQEALAEGKGDLNDVEFRKRIIDTFVNCVYAYDDRIIVFYNIRGCKNVSPADMFSTANSIPARNEQPTAFGEKNIVHNAQDASNVPSCICISNSMDTLAFG